MKTFKATNKEITGTEVTVEAETEKEFTVHFTLKGKKHVGRAEKAAVVNGEGPLAEYDLAPGETMMLNRFAKQSTWLKKHTKAEQQFLLNNMGKWHQYLGRVDKNTVNLLIEDKAVETPELYVYKY
jgi:hypothetical protein